MASRLRRHGKTSWQFCVSSGTTVVTDPVTGQKRRRPVVKWFTITAETKPEAEAKKAEVLSQLARGAYVEPAKLTLREFVETHFLPHLAAEERSPSTIDSYRRICAQHILPALGHLPMDKVTPVHVSQWFDALQTKPRTKPNGDAYRPAHKPSLRSRQYWRAVLHRVFAYAVELEMLARNPVAKIRPPRLPKRKPDAFTADEVAAILAAAPKYRVGALVATALLTGARVGELLALRWDTLDMAAGSVTLRRTLLDAGNQKEGREPVFKESTKDSEARTIPLAPELVPVLRAWRRRWVEERLKAGTGYHDRFGLVFPTETGWPQSESNVNREFRRVCHAATVRRLTVHCMRHTFATRLLDAGADIDTAAELLGDDIQTVKRNYIGDRPEAKKAAVQALGRLLASTPATASEASKVEAEAVPAS